jgi:predicted NUDIX family phosphoesterase
VSEQEEVLVVPTALFHRLGLFQGFSPEVSRYLPGLLDPAHLCYLPRAAAETDPSFKQLIPYVVLRCGGRVYFYTRGSAGTEARLRARRSVGIGGHVSRQDAAGAADPYRAGLLREVAEEVFLETAYRERALGLINDDSTPVGQVHLGVVHLFDLDEPHVRRREAALVEDGFAPPAELRADLGAFETWSQFLLEGGWLEDAAPSSPER